MAITKDDVQKAQKLATELITKEATTSQLRKFMTDVTRLRVKSEMMSDSEWKEKIYPEFLMLEPRLEYQINRDKKLELLLTQCKPRMEKIKDRLNFIDFALFVEAVIAYHKESGSPDRSTSSFQGSKPTNQPFNKNNNYNKGGNKW